MKVAPYGYPMASKLTSLKDSMSSLFVSSLSRKAEQTASKMSPDWVSVGRVLKLRELQHTATRKTNATYFG